MSDTNNNVWNLSVISAHDNWNKFDLSNFLNTNDFISAKLFSTINYN
jgi:hypothetical protein